MKEKVEVSAPGKLMLLGEHAVVYNRPCIVTAVGQRMHATLEVTDEKILSIEAPDVQVTGYTKLMSEAGKGEIPKGARFVEMAVKNFTNQHPIPNGLRVTTRSGFSEFGFGSSSASIVCVTKGLSEILGLGLDNRSLFNLSYQTVLGVQGTGSGFDVAAGIYGGTLYFFTGGKEIEPLEIESLPLVVGYTGIKADTTEIIREVAQRFEGQSQLLNILYDQISTLVKKARVSLKLRDWTGLGDWMNYNQEFLTKLGVSSQKLDDMIAAARRAGAFGAKLSGAGGGDCMIALVADETREKVAEAIIQAGGQVINVDNNVEGARIES